MSTSVDNRIVQMQFNNKNFEKNCSQTMSSLDKLKEKLKFSGVSKGFDGISKSVKKVDLNPLAKGIETIRVKFSALEVMSVTALANITNSAVNAGKRIVSALTIDPIKTGFQEYETQINAIQTILANTSSKGTTLDQVNAALDQLNTYADKTIYNFTEMTRNIGTFTAAGVDLDTSVKAIQGIANLAAVSGSSSQQASTAMYQLSQALAAGTVKLMDWNSVVNAGMGGEVFQNALKRTATVMGTNVDAMIEKAGSFRESLSEGWITGEVLTETLNQFTMAAEEGSAEWEKFKTSLKEKGYTEEQATEILKMANTATDAATKVKTFSQLWDTLKETAQSGWTQTWEIIVGDFEEAKSFLTELSDMFGNTINAISDSRNNLLESALGSNLDKLTEKINEAGISTDEFHAKLKETASEHGTSIDTLLKKYGSWEKVLTSGKLSSNLIVETLKKFSQSGLEVSSTTEDMTAKLKKFQDVVESVKSGNFGNGAERIQALTKAGYDYSKVQELVNKSLSGYKLTIEDLSESQLKSIGYTDDEIKKIKELATEAGKAGTTLNEIIENLDKPSGRELLIGSLKNVIEAIAKPLGAISKAWHEVFSIDPNNLYKFIEGLNKFTSNLIISDKNAERLSRTFKGLFAAIDMGTSLVFGPFKVVLKIISELLEMFNLDILDITASMGDAIVDFRESFDSFIDFGYAFETIMPYVRDAAIAFSEWFKSLDLLDRITPKLREAADALQDWFESLQYSDNIPRDIMIGLANGIQSGADIVVSAVMEVGKQILSSIKAVLGIHSPSVEFYKIGQNTMLGFYKGLKVKASWVWQYMQEFGAKLIETAGEISKQLIEYIKGIDFGKILAVGLGASMIYLYDKTLNTVQMIVSPLKSLSGMLDNLGGMFKNIGESFKTKGLERKSKAILNFAIALGILATSLYVLSKIDTKQLFISIGALALLAGMMTALAFAMSKLDFGGEHALKSPATTILALAASLWIMATAMKKLSTIDSKSIPTVLITFTAMISGLTAIMILFGKFVNPVASANMDKAAFMILKISTAISLMTFTIKQIAAMNNRDIAKGLVVILAIEGLFAAIMYVSKFAGANAASAGGMLLLMAGAMITMLSVIKLAAKLESSEIRKSISAITMIGILFAGLVAVSKYAGKYGPKAGAMLLLVSGSMLIMAFAIKQFGKLDTGSIAKGIVAVSMLEILCMGLIAVSKLSGEHAVKAGFMILTISGSLLVIAGAIFILSKIDPSGLRRGLVAVEMLGMLFGQLMFMAKFVKTDIMAPLIVMTVAIGLLTAAVIALTFIDPKKVAKASASLSMVLMAFGLLIASTKFIRKTKGLVKALLPMLGVLTILTGIVVGLSMIDAGSAIQSCAGITLLMVAMSASMLLIGKVGTLSVSVMKTMSPMLAVVTGLAAILGVMSYLDAEPSIKSAVAISLLLATMAGVMALLSVIGPVSLAGIGALAALSLVVAGIAAILGVMSYFDVEASIKTATSISILLATMTGVLAALTLIGVAGPASFVGIGALATLVAGTGTLLVAIGALVTYVPQVEEFLDRGIPVLEKIGYALGAFFGNIIGGIAGGASNALPVIGQNLSGFIQNLGPFIDGVKAFDETASTGVKSLASSILMLTGANLLSSIVTLMKGTTSFEELGTSLSNFMINARPFFDGVTSISPETAKGVSYIADAILSLTASNVLEGLTSWFTGGTSLADFGDELAKFGPKMKQYADSVVGINSEAVSASASATKAIAEMATAIPNSGGLLSLFTGDNDLSSFGISLVSFGTNLKNYSVAVNGLLLKPIQDSVEAVKAVSTLSDEIPNVGGLVTLFIGDNDLSTFGMSLVTFGTCLKNYSVAVTGINAESIEASSKAVKSLTKMVQNLPEQGGFLSIFTADNDMSTFGKELNAFGISLKSYSDHVVGIDINAVNNSVTASKSIVKFINSLKNVDTSGIRSFKEALISLGNTNMSGFIKAFSGSNVNLTNIGSNMINAINNGIMNNQQKLVATANLVIDSMANAFNSKRATLIKISNDIVVEIISVVKNKQTAFATCGTQMIERFTSGINKGKIKVTSSLNTTLVSFITAIRNKYSSFYDAGSYLVQGFANGIRDNTYKAEAKARAMAKAADEAAREALGIHSPSTVGIAIGTYFAAGVSKGISDETTNVIKSTLDMAKQMVEKFKDKIDQEAFKKSIISIVQNGVDTGVFDETKFKKKIVDTSKRTYEETVKWVEKQKKVNNLSLEQELAAWENVQKRYKKGSEERIKIDEEIARVEREMYEASSSWIQKRKNFNNLTLVEELAAWKRIQSRYKHGSEQREQADLELYNVKQQLIDANEKYYKDATELQEEFTDKRKELEEEYADKVQEINDRLKDDIASVEQEYEDALESRTKELYKAYGLFDKPDSYKYVSKDSLIENLEDQITAFESWTSDIQSLASRGVDSELMDELEEMGPTSRYYIEALNSMTDDELDRYVSLWRDKNRLAKNQASYELSDMKAETSQRIQELNAQAEKDLEEYKKTWTTKMEELKTEYAQKLDDIKKEWMEKVVGWNEEKSEFTKLGTDLMSLLGMKSNWSEAGADIIEGVLQGIVDKSANLNTNVESVMTSALEAAKTALGIHSPSTEFMSVGEYAILGFIEGFENTSKKYFGDKSGSELIMSFINGINAKLKDMSKSATGFVNIFMDTVKSSIDDLNQTGQFLMINFIDGMYLMVPKLLTTLKKMMSSAVSETRRYYSSFKTVGGYLVQGFANGIDENTYLAEARARAMARAAAAAAAAELDVNSPSKVGYRIGNFFGQGFVNGIDDYTDISKRSGSNLAYATITALSESIAKINDYIDDDLNTDPVITPVLDLSDLESKTGQLNALFSRSQATAINARMSKIQSAGETGQNGNSNSPSSNTFNFTQNNYSPKSLSRLEIYRQTKNAFSTMKGLVKS